MFFARTRSPVLNSASRGTCRSVDAPRLNTPATSVAARVRLIGLGPWSERPTAISLRPTRPRSISSCSSPASQISFTDGVSNYIGTAGHCAGGGKTVIAQIGTRVDPTNTIVTLAAIGTVVKSVNNGIGRDFALVKIDPAFKVDPGVAG